jgi:hypothetical protein
MSHGLGTAFVGLSAKLARGSGKLAKGGWGLYRSLDPNWAATILLAGTLAIGVTGKMLYDKSVKPAVAVETPAK